MTNVGAWRAVSAHRALALLLFAALPVEIAAAANLVVRVGSADASGGGVRAIGGAFAAMSLAFAGAAIPAGLIVDRTPARRTFALALTVRALPMLLGGLIALNGSLSTTTVIALAAGDGLAMALLRPSWQHFQACLVPADAARDAAVLDDWIARAGALLGAILGGAAVAIEQTAFALLVCAAGFLPLLAALALGLGSSLREPISTFGPTRSLADARSAIRSVPRLVQATRADVVLALALPVGVLAPAVTVALSAVEYLWLIALGAGIGALAGTSLVTLAWNRACPARMLRFATRLLVASLAVQAAALAAGLLSPTPLWLTTAFLMVALTEGAITAIFAVTGSIVQAEAPEDARGVVTGLAQAMKHVATFASASAVGMTMAWAGPAVTLGLISVALAAAAIGLRGFAGLAHPLKMRNGSSSSPSAVTSARESGVTAKDAGRPTGENNELRLEQNRRRRIDRRNELLRSRHRRSAGTGRTDPYHIGLLFRRRQCRAL